MVRDKAAAIPTKELIYDAAVEVFAERGFYSATTDAIAEAAGVSVGTIYNYFRNKEELLSAIFERELAKRLSWLMELREHTLTAKETLERFFDLHVDHLQRSLETARILLRERSFARDNDPQALRSYMRRIPGEISNILKAAQSRGEIREDIDANVAATVIFHAMEGLVAVAVENDRATLLPEGYTMLKHMLWDGLAVAGPKGIRRGSPP